MEGWLRTEWKAVIEWPFQTNSIMKYNQNKMKHAKITLALYLQLIPSVQSQQFLGWAALRSI
jgi:hypothetical protein